MPPLNLFFGHLFVIKQYLDQFPADFLFNYIVLSMSRTFPKHHMFYLDFWPFTILVLIVSNPHAADLIMRHFWVQKPQNVLDAFLQMSGGLNLVTMPEGPWKRWRSIFNQGFSPAYMLEQIPRLVDQGQIFCEKLRNHARNGDLFQSEEATFRFTIDVIGLVGL
jgi:cytochrome P450